MRESRTLCPDGHNDKGKHIISVCFFSCDGEKDRDVTQAVCALVCVVCIGLCSNIMVHVFFCCFYVRVLFLFYVLPDLDSFQVYFKTYD